MWASQSPICDPSCTMLKYSKSLNVGDFAVCNSNGQTCLHKAAQRGNKVCDYNRIHLFSVMSALISLLIIITIIIVDDWESIIDGL